MNREDITVNSNANVHFIGFTLRRALRHRDAIWAIPSDEYQHAVLDYYGGRLLQINGIELYDIGPYSVRVWISDEAIRRRDEITDEVLRVLTTA